MSDCTKIKDDYQNQVSIASPFCNIQIQISQAPNVQLDAKLSVFAGL